MQSFVPGAITVLLGAGASVEAGLPTSADLTEELAFALAQRDRTDVDPYGGRRLSAVFRAVVAVLAAWDATHGHGTEGPIDVERVYAALLAIRDRDDQEVAPFVSSWSPFLAQSKDDELAIAEIGQSIKHALEDGTYPQIGATMRSVFAQLEALNASRDVFGAVADAVVNELPRALYLGDSSVDYLAPLWRSPADTVVATLNYDLTIEASAARSGVSLSTGADAWRGGFSWSFGEGRRLLKLHGSVDWTLVDARDSRHAGVDRIARFPRYTRGDPDAPFPRVIETRTGGAPAVVFGRGNKMRPEGPYTALLVAFEAALMASPNLVVIGYSFRDTHVNAVLERWYTADPNGRGLFVVDPGFPSRPRMEKDYAWTIGRRLHGGNPGGGVLPPNRGLLRVGAAEGLAELFGT